MLNPTQIRWSNIAPEGYMSDQGDYSHEFTMDLSNRDFHEMILYNLFVVFVASLISNASQV